jgi:hypothetical protein
MFMEGKIAGPANLPPPEAVAVVFRKIAIYMKTRA